jgi:GNAT superfamily N-acetyltransferase
MSRLNGDTRKPAAPVTPGKLEVLITYLEMTARPALTSAQPPGAEITVVRAKNPTVSFYRFLYNSVGEPWHWYERRDMDDDALRTIVQHPDVEVCVLRVEGVPAGYVELDRHVAGEVEIAYLGLMPEFIGRGLGRFLLDWAVIAGWHTSPRRLWVHTCSLDHPSAIAAYQRAGFVPYKKELVLIDDPRKTVASGE